MSASPADRLPEFPWDVLAPFAARAAQHPQGAVDLSVGTPVDPTPAVIQAALVAAANAPGYPTTAGSPAVREAAAGWIERRLGAQVSANAVLPAIGSKELVAWLPTLLGLGPKDRVVIPKIAYPTYAVGAALVGAEIIATDRPEDVAAPSLIWINTPSNPTGAVLSTTRMAESVAYGRSVSALVVSDECYLELGWDVDPVSVLHPGVSGADHSGVLGLFSLSKRSNLAGYRFGFAAGDQEVVTKVIAVRKHLGMMVPAPIQAAAVAALDDDAHVTEQRSRYAERRQLVWAALVQAGFSIDHSEAGLYLWVTRGEPCWQSVSWFADRGIIVTPGDFYGAAGADH
ncbi:MAG: succinyldiaminopimelate transaminase, partial [Actinobacteria bacterium]|nr:succinyldiaminopimelate transaminase [Actinomycetota bacterium]